KPRFQTIVRTRVKHVPWAAPTFEKIYVNKNGLLGQYRGADGVKTGWTTKAGHCLVTSARRDGAHLIVVLLAAPNRYRDAARLLNYGFGLRYIDRASSTSSSSSPAPPARRRARCGRSGRGQSAPTGARRTGRCDRRTPGAEPAGARRAWERSRARTAGCGAPTTARSTRAGSRSRSRCRESFLRGR